MPSPGVIRRLGGQSAFNPNSYGAGTLKGWFKADSLQLSDGASVTTWADSSGNGNDATAGTAPVFKAGVQNGKPGVLFTKTSTQYLNAAGLAAIASGTDLPYTIIQAVKGATQSTANTQIMSSWGASGAANPRIWNYTNSDQYNTLRRDDAATQLTTATGAIYTLTAQILTFHYSGTTSTVWRDGVLINGPTSRDVGAMTVDLFRIGSDSTSGGAGSYYDGHFFELIVFASALSTNDRVAIERALGLKWGIVVA